MIEMFHISSKWLCAGW